MDFETLRLRFNDEHRARTLSKTQFCALNRLRAETLINQVLDFHEAAALQTIYDNANPPREYK